MDNIILFIQLVKMIIFYTSYEKKIAISTNYFRNYYFFR